MEHTCLGSIVPFQPMEIVGKEGHHLRESSEVRLFNLSFIVGCIMSLSYYSDLREIPLQMSTCD